MLAAEKKELGKYCSEAVGGIVDLLEVNLSNLLNLISLKKMFMKSKSMLEFKKICFPQGCGSAFTLRIRIQVQV